MSAPILDGAFKRVAKAHGVRQWAVVEGDDFEFLWFLSFSGFGLSELEQFGLFHITLFLAVHLLIQVASGLITLAAKRGRPLDLKRGE